MGVVAHVLAPVAARVAERLCAAWRLSRVNAGIAKPTEKRNGFSNLVGSTAAPRPFGEHGVTGQYGCAYVRAVLQGRGAGPGAGRVGTAKDGQAIAKARLSSIFCRGCSSWISERAWSPHPPHWLATPRRSWSSSRDVAPPATASRISRSVTPLQIHTYIVARHSLLSLSQIQSSGNANDCQLRSDSTRSALTRGAGHLVRVSLRRRAVRPTAPVPRCLRRFPGPRHAVPRRAPRSHCP